MGSKLRGYYKSGIYTLCGKPADYWYEKTFDNHAGCTKCLTRGEWVRLMKVKYDKNVSYGGNNVLSHSSLIGKAQVYFKPGPKIVWLNHKDYQVSTVDRYLGSIDNFVGWLASLGDYAMILEDAALEGRE